MTFRINTSIRELSQMEFKKRFMRDNTAIRCATKELGLRLLIESQHNGFNKGVRMSELALFQNPWKENTYFRFYLTEETQVAESTVYFHKECLPESTQFLDFNGFDKEETTLFSFDDMQSGFKIEFRNERKAFYLRELNLFHHTTEEGKAHTYQKEVSEKYSTNLLCNLTQLSARSDWDIMKVWNRDGVLVFIRREKHDFLDTSKTEKTIQEMEKSIADLNKQIEELKGGLSK